MSRWSTASSSIKRRNPCDDLIGALVRATDENGDSLSSDELLGMSFLLLVGGHESTANLIASGTLALLRHPEQLAALRADWSLLDTAVEEVLRYDGPVEFAALGYTKEPIDIGGTVIGEGEVIMIGQLALEVSTSTVCRSVLTPPGPGGHPSVGGS